MSVPLASQPPDSGSTPKFRVAICGAGIGGLVLAITIGRYDPSIPIDLYEAHDCIETVGAGITLWRQTHEVMTKLGLFDEFKQILTFDPERLSGPIVRRGDIPEGGYVWYQRIRRHAHSAMHRQHMIVILERNLPPSCTVHYRKRLVNYVEPEEQDVHLTSPITLNFADGTFATTDVLVGADGIRSAVRKTMFENASKQGHQTDLKQYIDAMFTGMSVYRCTVPAETLRQQDPNNVSLTEMLAFSGKGAYLATYPISKGALINVVAIVSDRSLMGTHYEGHWVKDATRDELVGHFENFEPNVRTVLKLCGNPSKWALHVLKPLPFCTQNRVVLIGDACHGMTPHFGAGGSQAIEDGFMLGRLLAHPLSTLSRIQDVLRIHQETRLQPALDMAQVSLSTGWMQSFMEPGYYDGTRFESDDGPVDGKGVGVHEREGMAIMAEEIFRRWDWVEKMPSAVQMWKNVETKLHAMAELA